MAGLDIMAAAAAAGSWMAANAGTIATVASVAGAGATAYGTIAAGKANQEAAYAQAQQAQIEAEAARAQGLARQQEADFAAAELERQAAEQAAAGQAEAEQYRRQKILKLSELQASSAASGFTATDPTSLALADEITKYGTLQESMARFGGDSRAAGSRSQAAATRFSGNSAYAAGLLTGQASDAGAKGYISAGKSARKGSYFDAGSTIAGSVSTLADRYDTKRVRSGTRGNSYRYG